MALVRNTLVYVPCWTLSQIEDAVRASWDAQTCDPAQEGGWSPLKPSRGQCVATAAVLHDLLGGGLLIAKVYVDGQQRGFHGWNRLVGGLEIDLTRDQFTADESIGEAREIARPADEPLRIQAQYAVLRERVLARLG